MVALIVDFCESAVGAALAWLSIGTARDGAFRSADLRYAARRPKRGMRHSLLDLIARQRSVGEVDRLINWLDGKASDRDAQKASEFLADLVAVRKVAEDGSTIDVLDDIRYRVGTDGLEQSASSLDGWSHGAVASHRDDLDALMVLGHLQPDPSLFGAWLAEVLGAPNDPAGVTLASIHAVKGREWEHVIVHDVTAGLMPHRLVDGIEEERRVFHVGLTRGISTVTLVPGTPPSPFLLRCRSRVSRFRSLPPGQLVSRRSRKPPPSGRGGGSGGALVGMCFDHGGYLHEGDRDRCRRSRHEIGDQGARLAVSSGVGGCSEFPGGWPHPNTRLPSSDSERGGCKGPTASLLHRSVRRDPEGSGHRPPADEASLARWKEIGADETRDLWGGRSWC